jgi:hypothetical protein
MADLRIPSAAVPAVARPQPAARVDAATAAQRAFFQAALGAAPAAPASPAPAAAKADPAAAPQRLPRPGSLLDIKV